MNGHRQILAARRRGLKPPAIFFDVGRQDREAEDAIAIGSLPVVCIDENEVADLRFVRGCAVHVSGTTWTAWLIALGEQIADAGARQVVVNAIAESPDLMIFDGEWRTV